MSLYDKLSKFPTTTKAGATADSNGGASYVTYKQITGLPVGVLISSVTFDVYSTPTDTSFKGGVYTDSGNNPTTLLASGELTNQNVSNTYTTLTIPLTSNATVPSDGKVWVAIIPNKTNPLLRVSTSSSSYTNSKYSTTTGNYTNYSSWMLSTASVVGSGENNVRFGVVYTTSVAKKRFVENFSGSALDTDRWNQNNRSGTGTFAMANDLDGGFSVTCSSNAGSASVIDFNNIRPFAHNGSVMIAVGKRITSGGYDKYGLCNLVSYGSTASQVYASDNSNNTYKNLVTGSGSSASSTLSDVAIDTNFTGYKIELSTDAKMTINGVLKVTHTTTLPTARLQPHIGAENNGATAIEMRVRYAEVYNT